MVFRASLLELCLHHFAVYLCKAALKKKSVAKGDFTLPTENTKFCSYKTINVYLFKTTVVIYRTTYTQYIHIFKITLKRNIKNPMTKD